ncbi:MAG: DUF2795 domain-containing protein [Chloroflexi bacterium]|nr:DUF2795 domain-containing protein [Chloroflexota bacterium]
MQLSEAQRELITEHIQGHLDYPAAKKALLEACNNIEEVTAETRQWVAQNLPDRTYNSAEDVLHALNLPHAH